MIEVVRIPALDDNYIWLAHETASGETVVIDPALAEPVLAEAGRRGWRIGQIWNTHWHGDHTNGNAGIKAATGCRVLGPAGEAARIPTLDETLAEGDTVYLGAAQARVLEMPGHTAGHIAYHFADAGIAFVGDTLFAMGCGRLFEGTAEQMWHNMERIAALPPETKLYCAHEYSLTNAKFALTIEPDNEALVERRSSIAAERAAGRATVPTTVALERATNPFLRAGSVDEFARRRTARDGFKG